MNPFDSDKEPTPRIGNRPHKIMKNYLVQGSGEDKKWYTFQGNLPAKPPALEFLNDNDPPKVEYFQNILDHIAKAVEVKNPKIFTHENWEMSMEETIVGDRFIYFWPGEVQYQEEETVEDGGGCFVAGVKTVAILLLPGHEPNENLDSTENLKKEITRLQNLIQHAFSAGRSKTSWQQFKKDYDL
jgi:hypothetical protein